MHLVYEDPDVTVATQLEELEAENNELRRRLDLAQREIQCRSPTKTATKKKKDNNNNSNSINILGSKLARMASDGLMTMTVADDSDVENLSSQMHDIMMAAPPQLPVVPPSPKPKPSGKKQRYVGYQSHPSIKDLFLFLCLPLGVPLLFGNSIFAVDRSIIEPVMLIFGFGWR